MKKILLLSIILLLGLSFAQDYSGQYNEQAGELSLNLVAVTGGYEGQLIQGEIDVKVQAQIADGRLQGLLLMKDIGFAKNVYFEGVLEGNQLNLTTAPVDDNGNLDKEYLSQYVLIRSQSFNQAPIISGKIPSGPNPLGGSTPSTSNPLGGNSPSTSNQTDFSGRYLEQDSSPGMELNLNKVANGYDGILTSADLRVRVHAENVNGTLIGIFYYKEAGYERDLYLEAALSGNELNVGFTVIDEQGNVDKTRIESFIMLKQGQATVSTNTSINTGSSPGKIGGANPLAGNPSSTPVVNPLGTNNPNSSNSFGGVYLEKDGTTRLELNKLANGYEGLLIDGDLKIKLQAEEEAGKLIGIFLFKDAGYEQNLYFEAVLSDNIITVQFAAIDAQGNVDQADSETFTMIRQSTQGAAPIPQTQIGSSNPLASSSSQDFIGTYEQDGARFVVQASANGYQGAMNINGNQLPFVAQLNGSVMIGKFSANGQEIPFEARLEGNAIILSISNETYQLSRVANTQANTSAGKIPTNPLTNRGNNNSQPIAQNPISTVPVTNSNTGSVVQAGQSYTAGSTVNSPWTGVSFSVPNGYTAAYEAETGFFIIAADNQQSVILLQSASKASARSMAGWAVGFIKELAEGEVQFLNDPQETQNSLKVSISGDGSVMHVESKSGANSNAVVVMAVGIDVQILSSFVATINLFAPQAQNIDLPLGGLALQRETEDGMAGGGLYNKKSENESALFCSDGRYGYEYYSAEDISMGGYNDTFTESDSHNGSWHGVASFIGDVGLMLEATDGRVLVYSVSQSANGVMMNDVEFQASQNGQCN